MLSRNTHMRGVILATLSALLSIGSALATVSITPAYVDVEIQNGRASGRFKIANLGDTEERFRMSTTHFTFSEEGELDTIDPDEYSAADWIKFNPKEFTLPPKTQRVVRFVLIPRGDVAPGEYWAAIELESLAVSQTQINDATVNTVSAILVPVFGRTGKVETNGAITKTETKMREDGSRGFETLVENMGNRTLILDGVYTLTDKAGEEVASGPIGKAYLLRASTRRFNVGVGPDLPAGDYTLNVKFQSPQLENGLEETFEVTW